VAADVVGLLTAFFASGLISAQNAGSGTVGSISAAAVFVASLPAWIVAAKLYGLYSRDEERAGHSTADDVVGVFHLITVGVWVLFTVALLAGLSRPSYLRLAAFWLLALITVVTARALARSLARRHPAYVQNTLIVGAGDVGQLIARKLRQHPEYRISLVGFVDQSPRTMRTDIAALPVYKGPDEVVAAVQENDVDRVIVAFSGDRDARLAELVRALRGHDVQIDVVPRLFDAVGPNSAIHSVEGLPLISVAAVRISRSSRLLKRSLDVIVATMLVTVTAPLLIAIALLIRRDSDGGAFFRQTRLGIDLKPFTMLKFRTMYQGTDDEPHRAYVKEIMTSDAVPAANDLYKLDRSNEITRIGRWLRKTSLDELPQLLNVIRGDMSLVGPRPAIPYEIELYDAHHLDRFAVPAGITGLWQVEARAHSTLKEALDLDVAYALGWSLGLDLRLLLRTPLVVFRKHETS
jgi:exopolysaccharide biosynthesis polyprenyl glycosylphosphotransferase